MLETTASTPFDEVQSELKELKGPDLLQNTGKKSSVKEFKFVDERNVYLQSVFPENIHTHPPPPTEGIGNSGGGGNCFFFFVTGLNFHTIVHKVLLFAFCFSSCEQKRNKSC